MVNSLQMQQLARLHERDLVDSAGHRVGYPLARQHVLRHQLPRITVRQRLGRTLVGVGMRIARDSLVQPEGEQLVRHDARPQRILVL
jgi:hypothetical protein